MDMMNGRQQIFQGQSFAINNRRCYCYFCIYHNMASPMEFISDELKDTYDNIEVYRRNDEGLIYKCVHKRTKQVVLLKKINSGARGADFFRKMLIWIELLDHDGILPIYYVHNIHNNILIAVEFMGSDLHQVILSKVLRPHHDRYIVYQILRILKYIHSANVALKNLRTERFASFNNQCIVRLENFEDAFVGVAEDRLEMLPDQWYRAPEALIGLNKHLTSAVDMWALGCILGELLSQGRPPFRGTSENQIAKILEFVECTEQDLKEMATPDSAWEVRKIMKTIVRRDIKEIYPNASEDALDLLKKLLQFNPKKRITADKALKHKYVASLIGAAKIYDCPKKIADPDVNHHSFWQYEEYPEELVQRLMDKFRQKVFEPITTAKILAHNIARSSNALKLLPLEMWTLIFSFIKCHYYYSCEPVVKKIFDSYLKRYENVIYWQSYYPTQNWM